MDIIASTTRVCIGSTLEYLDLVQIITDCITGSMGFDEDSAHWIGMSVRESVTNAIQHGNKLEPNKKVEILYEIAADHIGITVKDQGKGFRIDDLPNPLDPENLLKPSGRGIFYIRSFMDRVDFRMQPQGGMEVYMLKRVSSNQGENQI